MSLPSKLLRLALAGGALWLIWAVWKPVTKNLPENLHPIETPAELDALNPGDTFLINGQVTPDPAAPAQDWLGRFTFVHYQRRDHSTSATKEFRIDTIADHRPQLHFTWTGSKWILPAASYSLKYAPKIPTRWWPRKWLGLARAEDWHDTSGGFIAGQEAIALGQIAPTGNPIVQSLLRAPLEDVQQEIGTENTIRLWLTRGAKSILTLFIFAFLAPIWGGGSKPQSPEPITQNPEPTKTK